MPSKAPPPTSRKSIFWISFIDDKDPTNEQLIGGCYVRATNHQDALDTAIILSINPGGEPRVFGPLTLEEEFKKIVLDNYFEKLLDEATVNEMTRRCTGGN